jgi:hypothetical protein
MVTNMRSAAGMVAIWVFAVVGVSATAWVAIDRAGRDITVATVSTLPPASLNTPTMGSESTQSGHNPEQPAPSPTDTGSPPPPAAPTPQDQTTSVPGGLVSARCTADAIKLLTAQPQNNWRVHVDTSNGQQIVVSFLRGDEDSQSRTEVTGVCTNGNPTFTTTTG